MQEVSQNFFLTHLNEAGEAQMVDVSVKDVTRRSAVAKGRVRMLRETFESIERGNTPKGDVLAVAKIAGIMGGKQTSTLIPLCHPLPISKIAVEILPNAELPGYEITATVITEGKTGVEMEALTAVSITALTLYDMAKALDKGILIESIYLESKTGGKSGDYQLGSK